MSEETNSRQPATPKPKSARAVVLQRLVRRIESGPKLSVWWLAVILFGSLALSALLTALDVWLKR